jgi:REP element-mobilizing transposase RayT
VGRVKRICYEGAWYHVFNRGISRKTIYFSDNHSGRFIELAGDISHPYSVEIHSYCLMRNHYHLLMHTPKGNLSDAMWYLGTHFSRFTNKTMGGDGPVFKDRFKSILIQDMAYLLQVSRYIHRNPIEAGIITNESSYQWSSLKDFLDTTSPNSHFLKKDFLLSHFKSEAEFAEYNAIQNSAAIKKFYARKKIRAILNSETIS